ncbi:hypothetical protein, partial [Chitinophaga sp.]|uniref:hypothetical protein n=1 Tax=Chitinophaga sp. TaxID=1869181 RepID=UPI002FDD4DE8
SRNGRRIRELETSVGSLKAQLQAKHDEVLGYNSQLNENKINAARERVNQLNNQLFGLQNRIENFHHLIETGNKRLAEMEASLATNEQ